MSDTIKNTDCNPPDTCLDISVASLQRQLECTHPLDGFSVTCRGVSTQNKCEFSSKCFKNCENTCFGIVTGTGGAPRPIDAKLSFIKKLLNFNN